VSIPVTFEDLDQQGPVDAKKPFFAIDLNSEDEILAWLKDNLSQLQANSWTRMEKVKWNYYRYKGLQYLGQVYVPRDVPETRKRYMPQMVIPLIKDAVDEKVARLLESKPTVTVIPKDDEERDKVDAKIAKRFLSHIDYQEKVPAKLRDWLKNAEISGETFLLPRWNPDKGEVVPEMKMVEQTTFGGKPKRVLHMGDIELVQFNPHYFFYEEHPSKKFENANFIFLIEYEYTEGLKRDYPSKAGDIHEEPVGTVYFDYEAMEEKPLQGFTRKVTFYHKAMKYLPEGFQATFVNNAILSHGPLPEEYQDGQLPPVRLIMGKNEEEIHGESPIEAVRGMAGQVNNYENLIIKQLSLTAHPKWMVEADSVSDQQLNNDTGIVKIKRGAAKPILAQANPVSPQLMEHSRQLQEKFYSFAKSNSVVRGEPPPGVTAFVALQYVSEAESRRLSTEVSLFSEAVVSLYQKILKVAAKRYRPGEVRTMMIAGKDNQFNLKKYDPATLQKNFAVVLQNSSGLPDSRAARIQSLIETEERWPGLVPREQVAEMVGFAQSPDKLYDLIGSAARSAEAENEHILDGLGTVEPAEWEMHIVHWKIHVSKMQEPGFKQLAAPEVIAAMEDHLRATEMLMMQAAARSPSFAQMLAIECPQFPMIMAMPLPPPPMPMDPMAEPPMAEGDVPPVGPEIMPQMMDQTMSGQPTDVPPIPPPEAPQPL
jgi:hypothetical protein